MRRFIIVLLGVLPSLACHSVTRTICGDAVTSMTSPAHGKVEVGGIFDPTLATFLNYTDPQSSHTVSGLPTIVATSFVTFDAIPSGTQQLSVVVECGSGPETIFTMTIQVM
jgi:hypothetical protein